MNNSHIKSFSKFINEGSEDPIIKVGNEKEIHDGIRNHFGLGEGHHEKSILDELLKHSHVHYDPKLDHFSLSLSHLGKRHNISIEVDSAIGHHNHSNNDIINLDLTQQFGLKLTLPLVYKKRSK